MTNPETNPKKPLPCPHGRLPTEGEDGWKNCPHCLGLNQPPAEAKDPQTPEPEKTMRETLMVLEEDYRLKEIRYLARRLNELINPPTTLQSVQSEAGGEKEMTEAELIEDHKTHWKHPKCPKCTPPPQAKEGLEGLDELVRDLTKIAPMPKSEVRRYILNLLAQDRQGLVEKLINRIQEKAITSKWYEMRILTEQDAIELIRSEVAESETKTKE